MKKRMFLSVLFAALLFCVQSAMAAVPTNVYITRVAQNGTELTMYIAAADSQQCSASQSYGAGDYALTLEEDDQFMASAVARLQDTGSSIHYVVCVDISGSIKNKEPQAIRDAVVSFAQGLKSNECMSLIAFGDAVEVLASSTRDAEEVKGILDGLKFNGAKTQLYEAIYRAVTLAQEHEAKYPYSVVIVLTDGTDEPNANGGDEYNYKSTASVVERAHIPVFTIAFERKESNLEDMAEIAEFSGGILQIRSVDTFSQSMCNIAPICRDVAVVTVPLNNDKTVHENIIGRNYTMHAMVNSQGSWMSSNNYSFGIDWSVVPTPTPAPTATPVATQAPTPEPTATPDNALEKLDVDDVTEDSTSVVVRTERNAHVNVYLDDVQMFEDDAKEQGKVIWDLVSSGVILQKGQKITAEAEDTNGNRDDISKVVGESRRQAINLDVRGIDNGTVNAETLEITGTAESGTQVDVAWQVNGEEPRVFRSSVVNGVFSCSIRMDEATAGSGYLSASYADGYGYSKQKVYPGVVNWDTEMDKGVDDTTIEPVNEDSTEVVVHTERNADVTVYHDGVPFAIGEVKSDADSGTARVKLQVSEYLVKGEKITVHVVDEKGHEATFDNIPNNVVDESGRTMITVNIDNIEGKTLSAPKMVVFGEAEPNTDLQLVWYKPSDEDGELKPIFRKNVKSLGGTYSYELPWQEGMDGDVYIEVLYSDLHGYSKRGATQGSILWATPSPEPTRVTPPPTEAPVIEEVEATPTVKVTMPPPPSAPPTVEPTPVPTQEPWPQNWIHGFVDYFGGQENMFRNVKFWMVVAAAVLVLVLIVVLIIFLVRKRKKGQIDEADNERERGEEFGELAAAGTVRKEGSETKATVRRPTPGGSNDPVRPSPVPQSLDGSDQRQSVQPGNGTRRINTPSQVTSVSSVPPSPTPIIPQQPSAAHSGTVRISAQSDSTSSGTVRISRQEAQPKPLTVEIHESRSFAGFSNLRTVEVPREIFVGRDASCQFVIQDETVSGKHGKLAYEGGKLYFTDNHSSNGSSLNGSSLVPNVRVEIHSGDTLKLGRTELVLRFGA